MSTEIKEEKIKAGEPITLAVIVKSPVGSSMSMPDFNDREALIQESRGQKKVIVLRCEFSNAE